MLIFEQLIARQVGTQKLSGGEYLICCPFHEDSTPSLSVNVKKGLFVCYGCGEKGNAAKLSTALVRSAFNMQDIALSTDIVEEHIPVELPDGFKPLVSGSGTDYKMAVNYIQKRGILLWQVRRHNIGYCYSGKYAYRLIVPVTLHGSLVSFVARDYTGRAQVKVRYPRGAKMSEVLFGYDAMVEDGWPKVRTIIVEGWADALAVERALNMRGALKSMGVVALGSSALSDEQAMLIKESREFIVMMDNDVPGQMATPEVAGKLSVFGKTSVASLAKSKDPGEAPPVEIIRAIAERVAY